MPSRRPAFSSLPRRSLARKFAFTTEFRLSSRPLMTLFSLTVFSMASHMKPYSLPAARAFSNWIPARPSMSLIILRIGL
jgi:hypothetical protein